MSSHVLVNCNMLVDPILRSYIEMVHQYYPSSVGLSKEKILAALENLNHAEWIDIEKRLKKK